MSDQRSSAIAAILAKGLDRCRRLQDDEHECHIANEQSNDVAKPVAVTNDVTVGHDQDSRQRLEVEQ